MKNTDFVTNFFDGLDAKGQAYLNYYFTREMMKEQFVRHTEMEKVKNEIAEDVMSRIHIRLEDEALKELRDLLNDLGR